MHLLTTEEVAAVARVKRRTVHSWAQSGRLRVVKAGRLNRFLIGDLERFLGLRPGSLGEPAAPRGDGERS